MHIYIGRNGRTYGPYTPAQFSGYVQAGNIVAGDAVCVQSGWQRVSDLRQQLSELQCKGIGSSSQCCEARGA